RHRGEQHSHQEDLLQEPARARVHHRGHRHARDQDGTLGSLIRWTDVRRKTRSQSKMEPVLQDGQIVQVVTQRRSLVDNFCICGTKKHLQHRTNFQPRLDHELDQTFVK
ncbi:unnamed protein product, partial [Larinioides sclopetarius]